MSSPTILTSTISLLEPERHEIVQALQDANATRYLSAVGLVILLFDHCLTFSDEVALVWAARRSFAKYAFLINRYLVLGCLLVVAHEMCGFSGNTFTSKTLIFTTSMLSLFSVGIANVLVLMRVVILWDRRPIILGLMVGGLTVSVAIQTAMMLLTLIRLESGIVWNPTAAMCITSKTSSSLIIVWAAPLLFEFLVLFATFINALDRPQQAEMPITKALYRDGISYFFALTCFRVLNLTLSIVARTSLTMLGVFFVWAMTTTILNRCLLHLRNAEVSPLETAHLSGRGSPFVAKELSRASTPIANRWLELYKLRSV